MHKLANKSTVQQIGCYILHKHFSLAINEASTVLMLMILVFWVVTQSREFPQSLRTERMCLLHTESTGTPSLTDGRNVAE